MTRAAGTGPSGGGQLGAKRVASPLVVTIGAAPNPGADLDLVSMVSARRPLAEAAGALTNLGSRHMLRQI
jgi:hypothetical protein